MKKKKRRFKFICFLLAVATLSCSLYFSSNKIMEELALSSFSALISNASYHAIDKIIDSKYDYQSLVKVTTDKDGQITMVLTDSFKVNSIATLAAKNAYDFLDKNTKLGVGVPLGTFTGIRLISGFGEKINMRLISVSSVKCEIVSDFKEGGINQTRHLLTVNIYCAVDLITKTSSRRVEDKISVLVYDNLIVGKVPEVFVNTQIIGKGSKN